MQSRTFALATARIAPARRRTREASRESLVEYGAIRFFLNQRGGESLAHPAALDSCDSYRAHGVERFRDRDTHTGDAQVGDEFQNRVSQWNHLGRVTSAGTFASTRMRSSSCFSSTPSVARIEGVSSSLIPSRTSARVQSRVSAIEGGFLRSSLRIALTIRAASVASR